MASNTFIIIAAIAGAFGGYQVMGRLMTRSPLFDKKLTSVASEMNKNLPMMLDRETQFDVAMAGPGRRFSYNYTLVNRTVAEINTKQFVGHMRPHLVNSAKTAKDMKSFRSGRVTLSYNYKDKNGKEITSIEIKPSEYA